MKEKVLLFSHNIHAFLINDIKAASKEYKRVVFVSPYSSEFDALCQEIDNVEYIVLPPMSVGSTLKGYLTRFDIRMIKDVISVLFAGKISVLYLKILGKYLFCTSLLLEIFDNIASDPNEWVVVSMWFSATSYAVSRLKERYPQIEAVSLAHSFEVDDSKNRYVENFGKRFCHEKLDRISFISRNVMENYRAKHMVPNSWNERNLTVDYLGTEKKESGENRLPDGDIIHIVSCSHCVKVKRIDLMIDTLKLVQNRNIRWTHIGAGALFEALKESTKELPMNIDVEWLGAKDNSFVHSYFANTPIDFLINTSSSEGIPVSIMEAMAYSIPVVATDVGGTNEIVSPKTGWLLDKEVTSPEIAGVIQKYSDLQNERKLYMKDECKKTFLRHFNAKTIRPMFYNELKRG